jgi:hypothetical protein
MFTAVSILQVFDIDKLLIVETDRLDYIIAGVLSQPDNKGNFKPIIYFSTKILPAEYNYEIYNKKLLTVIRAFEK